MYTNLPYLYDGEIIEVQKPNATGQIVQRDNIVRYTILVTDREGNKIIARNAEECSMFGGVGDYFQRRARTSTDSGDDIELKEKEEENDARIGDRVCVMFAGGHLEQPRIVGWRQHPNQSNEFPDPTEVDPQGVLQYLGMRFKFLPDGGFQIIHQGAPTITPTPADIAVPNLDPTKAPANPAIEPADEENLTVFEMLDGGVFRVRDFDGQIIEIDRTKQRIYISNNDLKSTEAADADPASGGNQASANSTDAEYLLLDKDKQKVILNARKELTIYSFGDRKDVTDKSHSVKVKQNWTVEIGGDAEIKASGGAAMKLSGGQVAMGGPGGELVDLLDQTLGALVKALGNLGYPLSTQPEFVKIQAALKLIKGKL